MKSNNKIIEDTWTNIDDLRVLIPTGNHKRILELIKDRIDKALNILREDVLKMIKKISFEPIGYKGHKAVWVEEFKNQISQSQDTKQGIGYSERSGNQVLGEKSSLSRTNKSPDTLSSKDVCDNCGYDEKYHNTYASQFDKEVCKTFKKKVMK